MANKPVILVVDDSPTMAQITQKAVESFGCYDVVVRENSTRAISYVGNNRVDLILMDIELMGSQFDGIETAKLIRSKYSIPVIFVTSYTDFAIFEDANMNTMFDVLIKPYDNKMLKLHIDIALQNNAIEKNYKELEFWFEALISGYDYGIFVIDENGIIIKMNHKAELITDYSRTLTIGKKLLDIVHISYIGQTSGTTSHYIKELSELISIINDKDFFIRRDGKTMRVDLILKPVNGAGINGYILDLIPKMLD